MTGRRRVDRAVEVTLAGLMALAVVNVSWQVVARYVLGEPSSFTDELSRFVLIWIGLLGAAHGVGRRMHLSMNLLTARMTAPRRERLAVVVDLLVALFAVAVMVVGGTRLVLLTLDLGQDSAALGVPLGIVYLALPVSGLLITYYTLGFVRVRLRRLRRGGVAD
jgi:TRAP-type C4-dicarboxylate transport system permease small subunit